MASPPCHKRKTSQPNWANLKGDLLQNIFKKLSFVDVYRTKPVCSWWNKNAKKIFKRSTSTSSREVPWLLFPPREDHRFLGKGDKTGRLLNLQERRFYHSFNNEATEKIMSSCCVGSSYGWLVCLDQYAFPFLLNPLTCKQIQLPPMYCSSLPTFTTSTLDYLCNDTSVWRERFVKKAILSSYPSNRNYYYVALIYDKKSSLAFCRVNGDGSWTKLDGKNAPYEDIIICNETQLYALGLDGSLEMWDIVDGCISPAKMMYISSAAIWRREDSQWVRFVNDADQNLKYYLMESSGGLLLVIRYFEYIVHAEEEEEAVSYLLREDCNLPLFSSAFPDQTLRFEVFKLGNDHKMWMQVDSLGDNVLFLGGSESISIPAKDCKMLKRDSIYFTDDLWDHKPGEYLFGGHDMGVFSLQDASIECFYGCHEMEKIRTTPVWVAPHPWF